MIRPIVKAYTNLGLAQLALNHPNEALTSSLTAYNLAIAQRSPSVASIAATCLEAKKKRWEQMESRRIEKECEVMRKMTDIIERDADKAVDRILRKGASGDTAGFEGRTVVEMEEEIRQDAREKVRTLEDVFGKAEAVRYAKREVPDYLIDNITFNIMLDPVIVYSLLSSPMTMIIENKLTDDAGIRLGMGTHMTGQLYWIISSARQQTHLPGSHYTRKI